MTGWGSSGPLADKGGHDLNYIAITGALHAMGTEGMPPPVPLNLVGDFGGGAMMLAMGVLAALHERQRSGRGQVVESAMSDGSLGLMALFFAMRDGGSWIDGRGVNQIQGGAHFYRCYETRDGEYMAVGAVENKFYAELIDGLGLDPALVATQNDQSKWPELQTVFASVFATRTRAEWEAVFASRDACVTPVLSMAEAMEYPHNTERDCVRRGARTRAGRAPGAVRAHAGDDRWSDARVPAPTTSGSWPSSGYTPDEIEKLRAAAVTE